MAINLTADAVHALNRAAAAAAREDSEAIAPGHILAGAISQRDPSLIEALDRLALDIEALPEHLRDAPEVYGGHLPFTPDAHEVLTAAIESAGPDNPTASAHLLVGVVKVGDEESRGVLEDWGVREDALTAALATPPADAPASGSATAPAVTALFLALTLACTADAAPPGSPAGDPFAATPADGPAPEIGPAPDDYRPTAAGAPSTDIWLGRLERGDATGASQPPGAAQQVTRTPGASEFSAIVIPGQDAFSAIHEERGVQYLWRYGTDGTDLGPIFATVEPVGYHAWADERTAAMFVLGDPPTLQVGDALSGEVRTVAESPGRSIHRIPGTAAISFVRKVSEDEWWIERLDPATGETERIAQTLPGREDYAWTPGGEILMGDGAALYAWTQVGSWTEVMGVAPGDISRIAVSPDGATIAIVRSR